MLYFYVQFSKLFPEQKTTKIFFFCKVNEKKGCLYQDHKTKTGWRR
jgi:hypothetical protein